MNKKTIALLFSILVVILGLYQAQSTKKSAKSSSTAYDKSIKAENGKPIKVAAVVDGDTITLVNGEKLRYIGIDTPEEFDARKPVQCFAKEAAEKNKELVEGKTILFYKDINTKDAYGRWLGYVYLEDGTFINEKLVKDGYAFAYPYPPDISKSDVFRAAETYARENKLGLWSGCSIQNEKGGREQTNPVD